MARFLAVAGNSCSAVRSLIVFLTMFWLIKVRSLYVEVQLNNKHHLSGYVKLSTCLAMSKWVDIDILVHLFSFTGLQH